MKKILQSCSYSLLIYYLLNKANSLVVIESLPSHPFTANHMVVVCKNTPSWAFNLRSLKMIRWQLQSRECLHSQAPSRGHFKIA